MRTELKTAVAALVAATLSTAALAQVSAETGVTVPGASATATATGEASASGAMDTPIETYGDVVASITAQAEAEGGAAESFAGIEAGTEVELVLVSDLNGEGAENAQALDQALDRMSAELDALRSDIESNTVLNAALADAGFEAAQVIAWDRTAEGTLVLVIDDRA